MAKQNKSPISIDQFALMQTDTPVVTYKKTILGKVLVRALNPYNGEPDDLILSGDPEKSELACYLPLWSEKEARFFESANRKHINNGLVTISTYPKSEEIKPSVNNLSDEEIEALVGPETKFMTLQNRVGRITSESTMYRFVRHAERLERPEKTLIFLRDKLSKLQSGDLEE